MPDFQQRIEILQEVGCIDADLVVQLKGRVACEINSGDELIYLTISLTISILRRQLPCYLHMFFSRMRVNPSFPRNSQQVDSGSLCELVWAVLVIHEFCTAWRDSSSSWASNQYRCVKELKHLLGYVLIVDN